MKHNTDLIYLINTKNTMDVVLTSEKFKYCVFYVMFSNKYINFLTYEIIKKVFITKKKTYKTWYQNLADVKNTPVVF